MNDTALHKNSSEKVEIVISDYQPDDLDSALDCFVELQDVEHAVDSDRRTGMQLAKEYLAEIQGDVKDKNGAIFVAKSNGQMAGLLVVLEEKNVTIEVVGTHAYVTDLVIKEKFRGQGIGTLLMNRAEEYARKQGITEIRITTLAKNDPAKTLYKKLQYQEKEITLSKALS